MGHKGGVKKLPKLHNVKGKRWKKGHSSSSNPEKNKFREAARHRGFIAIGKKNDGPSALTLDALAIHDKSHHEVSIVTDSDQQTSGTFKTWATNWTECTNTTFNKVHRMWSSNSILHKEILAVLAAITEVIKMEGGKETETEYFAALMTALESAEELESITAIVYLLSLVFKRVPAGVLRVKFSEVSKCFMDLLGRFADEDATSLLKALIMSLAFLLRSQEYSSWNNSSTQHVYKGLLTFVTHKKPKVRKAAQKGVCIVLKGSLFMMEDSHPLHHPAGSLTAKHCVQAIEACGGLGDAMNTLYTLSLLRHTLPVFPQNSIKLVCETILKVMTASNVMVTAAGMQTLNGLFSAHPKPECLPAELNAQIISALYDYQPSENDVQPIMAWLVVMEAAHSNLARLDNKLCLSHLPKLFSAGMVCLLSQKTDVAHAAAKSLMSVITNCIAPMAEIMSPALKNEGGNTSMHKVIKAMETGLGYQFHASWGMVLQMFAVLYTSLGKHCPSVLQKSLSAIGELRDSAQFTYKGEVDHAVGCAIKSMGPKYVLLAIPLQITGQSDDLDFARSWLLPVLRDNIQQTELSVFTSYFLPLAAKLRMRALELSDQQNIVACKTYETLQLQIWSLLPGFCTKPTDLAQSFKGIAKVLGTAISERDDLRMDVMASLRKLITQNIDCEESRAELAKFSKNFVPLLFNLYTSESTKEKDPTKLAVLETIKCYLQITDTQTISSFCEKCSDKLKEDGITANRKYALHDLLIVMIPYLGKTKLKQMYHLAGEHLQDIDKKLQKKCYRIIEEITSGKSEECRMFVAENLKAIQETLVFSLSSSSPSSKAPRLKCLMNIVKQLDTRQEDFLLSVIPEAIVCTKEIAERARSASYNLLVEIGHAALRWSEETEVLDDFFKMVLAGFAGSPLMISCTLLSLTRIMYEFKDKLSEAMLASVIDNVCLLLKSKSREVVQSALAFTKVTISSYPVNVLAPHLKSWMESLTSMKEDCHHHFRFKSKEVYSKLIRKFGYETIFGMATDNIRKVLVNIRKTNERTKKKRKDVPDSDEEEEEDDKRFTSQPESIDELLKETDSEPEDDLAHKRDKVKNKKVLKKEHKGRAWLHEGMDDITDFMDVSAAKKVFATQPEQKKATKTDGGFKTAPDGRFIITESSDEADGGDSEDENIDDLLEALENGRDSGKLKQNQQKKRKLENLANSDEDEASAHKYTPGGKGIHRPLVKKQKISQEHTQFGQEYKAKKAGGDVKRKGKPDPYAYVPLDFKSLNKRKQAKFTGQFKNLVRGAKKGAAKGKMRKKKF